MAESNLIALPDFAKLMGVSRTAVNMHIKKGKLKARQIGRTWFLDEVQARKDWENNRNRSGVKSAKALRQNKDGPPGAMTAMPEDNTLDSNGNISMHEAERREKFARSEISRIKLEEMRGELVRADQVKKEAFATARKLRDAIMAVPARLAPELASETDPHKVEIMLTKELSDCLEKIIGAGDAEKN